jgi:4-carboxymuconolactone decarboxylase
VARLNPVTPSELSSEQKRLFEIITATRGGNLGGPLSILIRTPHLAGAADDLHNAFRLRGKLDRRPFEMLVLLVARHSGAGYAWEVHEQLALKAGLAKDVISAIYDRSAPRLTEEDDQLIYDLATELLSTKTIDKDAYRAAIDRLGAELLIEVVAAVGFYSMVCLLLNSFEVDTPSGRDFPPAIS